VNVEDYKTKARLRGTPIVENWITIEGVTEASFCEERIAGSIISGLEQRAAAEANAFYDNPLGCGRCSLALIRSRWELATAIGASLKEYRKAFHYAGMSIRLDCPPSLFCVFAYDNTRELRVPLWRPRENPHRPPRLGMASPICHPDP
jgi:hypothetical protein